MLSGLDGAVTGKYRKLVPTRAEELTWTGGTARA